MTPRLSLSLLDYWRMVPDPRSKQGQRYPLHAILAHACAAVLCGCRSLSAIAQWGRDYGPRVAPALGYKSMDTPCTATFHLLFKGLDSQAFDAAIGAWADGALCQTGQGERLPAMAMDGKALRGTLGHAGVPSLHLLAAVSHCLGLSRGQIGMEERVHESTAALALLKTVDLAGWLVTSDAILTQSKLAKAILKHGGDYLMVVKGNTPTLLDDISFLFSEPQHLLHLAEAQTTNLHGDRIEVRRLWASSDLIGYLEWPGAQQVLRQERTIINKKTGRTRGEVAYGVTSLSSAKASASQLLGAWRGHWTIEGLHWIRDVTFGEDHSQVRTGNAPSVMASLRNAAIGLIRSSGHTNVAAACRHHAAYPEQALALLNTPLREN